MPEWIEKWINGYLARLLGMSRPESEPGILISLKLLYYINYLEYINEKFLKEEINEGKKSHHHHGSANDISSKSLLANVLDMNDEFGVVGSKPTYFVKEGRLKSKLFNENLTNNLANYQKNRVYLKHEPRKRNYSSSCENCGDTLNNYKSDSYSFKKNLHAILKEIKQLTKKIKEEHEDEEKELNWKFAAMVIDRLCMWIFTVATVVSTAGILLTSKNFFRFK